MLTRSYSTRAGSDPPPCCQRSSRRLVLTRHRCFYAWLHQLGPGVASQPTKESLALREHVLGKWGVNAISPPPSDNAHVCMTGCTYPCKGIGEGSASPDVTHLRASFCCASHLECHAVTECQSVRARWMRVHNKKQSLNRGQNLYVKGIIIYFSTNARPFII